MKRLIFSLLYEDGHFVLSRNFQRQKVGDINWLLDNYNLENVSLGLDELIIIDVSSKKNKHEFHNIIKKISQKIFIPLTVGGGINNLNDVEKYLKNGADKILLNNLFFKDKKLFNEISKIFGKQFIVACIDYKMENEKYLVYKNKAKELCNSTFLVDQIESLYLGWIVKEDHWTFKVFFNQITFVFALQIGTPFVYGKLKFFLFVGFTVP